MRIDMTIVLNQNEYDSCGWNHNGNPMWLRLTIDQARALRNQITAHLRGASRDKEAPKDAGEKG